MSDFFSTIITFFCGGKHKKPPAESQQIKASLSSTSSRHQPAKMRLGSEEKDMEKWIYQLIQIPSESSIRQPVQIIQGDPKLRVVPYWRQR